MPFCTQLFFPVTCFSVLCSNNDTLQNKNNKTLTFFSFTNDDD